MFIITFASFQAFSLDTVEILTSSAADMGLQIVQTYLFLFPLQRSLRKLFRSCLSILSCRHAGANRTEEGNTGDSSEPPLEKPNVSNKDESADERTPILSSGMSSNASETGDYHTFNETATLFNTNNLSAEDAHGYLRKQGETGGNKESHDEEQDSYADLGGISSSSKSCTVVLVHEETPDEKLHNPVTDISKSQSNDEEENQPTTTERRKKIIEIFFHSNTVSKMVGIIASAVMYTFMYRHRYVYDIGYANPPNKIDSPLQIEQIFACIFIPLIFEVAGDIICNMMILRCGWLSVIPVWGKHGLRISCVVGISFLVMLPSILGGFITLPMADSCNQTLDICTCDPIFPWLVPKCNITH